MPNWSLLTSNPMAFFELNAGFDRKDLKRAYGKLIKEFKPESHPAEFQRIREAYELLESQHRYGVVQTQLQQAADAWVTAVPAEPSVEEAGRKRSASLSQSEASFEAEWWTRTAEENYKWLKSQSKKSPQMYFALATVSDLVEPRSANMYLKWLLTGIREYPEDPGLLRLVSEYLSAFADLAAAVGTLQTIAKLISGDEFYRVTEPLWLRLHREGGFVPFAKSLEACERLLKHRSLRPRLAFYVHILRNTMWTAPPQWTEERLKFIESHGSELGSDLDDEISLLRALHKYRHHDREQLIKTSVGAKVDELISAYCKGNSMAALTEAALVCDELARNGTSWQQAFPAAELAKYQDSLWLCMLVVSEVAHQTGVEFGLTNDLRMQQMADAAVSDIVKTISEIGNRIFWLRARVYGLPFLVYWIGPLILTFGWSYWILFVLAWTVIAGMSFAAIAVPFYFKKRVDIRVQKLIEREYEDLWRPRLFRYVQACHAPAQKSIGELQKSAADLGHSELVNIVLAFASEDRAMQLFNFLQLFVH